MFGIGFTEIILIAVLAVVVLGPDKLPQLGKTLARVLSEFNKIKRDFRMTVADIERVGEKATSDIRSEVDEVEDVSFERKGDKAESGSEDTGFVAEDIDEVPESFEPEVGQKPGPRKRRRRAPRKIKAKAGVSEEALKKADATDGSQEADAPQGANGLKEANALPTPEGTRQAAGVLGAKPAATRPRRRRKPAATAGRATTEAKTLRAKSGAARATGTKSTRTRSTSTKPTESGPDTDNAEKTAKAAKSRRPRSKKTAEPAGSESTPGQTPDTTQASKAESAPSKSPETKPETSPETTPDSTIDKGEA